MRRSRLLLALPAATALVFTGIAPAAAGGGNGHHDGDDAWAKVVEIHDEAELEDDGDELDVTFEYKCEEDDRDSVTADVTAENGASYKKDDVDLHCNGDWQEITVTLKKDNDDEFEEGDWVKVTVTINENGDVLAEESEWVEVVDEENGDRRDGDHHDDDKDHHDPH